MKKHYIIIGVLLILCTILSVALISAKTSGDEEECKSTPNSSVTDFDSLNYINSFDVSDFSGTELNTIDIAAKKYTNNVISIWKDNKNEVKSTCSTSHYG